MITNVYSIKDSKVGWLQPTFETNDDVAMRNFAHAIMSSKSILTTHKQDFDLFKIGTFDTDSGLINSCIPQFIIGGDSVVVPDAI